MFLSSGTFYLLSVVTSCCILHPCFRQVIINCGSLVTSLCNFPCNPPCCICAISRLLYHLTWNLSEWALPFLQWYEKFTDADEVIPVSAKYGHGVDDVKEWILSKLPCGPAYYPKVYICIHWELTFMTHEMYVIRFQEQ